MARRNPARGRLPVSAPTNRSDADPDFAARWNAEDKAHRKQIRRLVRIGRPQVTAGDAELAVAFADYQRGRPWYRWFWLWLVPILIGGLVAAVGIHPLVVGMVLGFAGNALLVRWNYRRVAKVNAELQGEMPSAPRASSARTAPAA